MLRRLRIKATPFLTPESYNDLMRARRPWVLSSAPSLSSSNIHSEPHKALLRDALLRSQYHAVSRPDYGTSRGQRPEALILPVSQPWPSHQASQRLVAPDARGWQAAPVSWLLAYLYSWIPNFRVTLRYIGILILVTGVGAFLYGVYLACLALNACMVAFGEWLGQLPAEIAKRIKDWLADLTGSWT